MNASLKAFFAVNRHTAAAGSQVRMVIGAKK